MSRAAIRLLTALVLCGMASHPASAQSNVLGSVGLGRLARPLDARARALGNSGVALHGGNLSAINPASISRINLAGAWLTMMPEDRSVEGDVASGDFSTADFPLVQLAIPTPYEDWVMSVAFGAFLDRDWGVEFIDTLSLSNGDVAFRETRNADGGVSEFSFQLAGPVSSRWSMGAALRYYAGESRLTVRRVFEDSLTVRGGDGPTRVQKFFNPYESTAALQSRGWGLSVGAEYQPIPEMILGAVATWRASLNVEEKVTEETSDVDLPVGLDLGGSWQLTPGVVLALALGWENWSSTGDDIPGGANDVWRFGTGAEFRALRGTNSAVFVRLGAHLERQPFTLGGGWPWERAVSFGVGANLRDGRGRLDATIELGRRADLEEFQIEESYRRLIFSMAIFTS